MREISRRVTSGQMAVAAALFLWGAGSTAFAQDLSEPSLRHGDRIRVTARSEFDGRLVGSVVALRGGLLAVCCGEDGRMVKVPVSRIDKLEVCSGRESRAGTGAAVGAIVGGIAIGLALSNPPSSADHFQVNGLAVITGAVVGAAGGALWGSTRTAERWVPASADGLRVSFTPVRGRGAAVALNVSW